MGSGASGVCMFSSLILLRKIRAMVYVSKTKKNFLALFLIRREGNHSQGFVFKLCREANEKTDKKFLSDFSKISFLLLVLQRYFSILLQNGA